MRYRLLRRSALLLVLVAACHPFDVPVMAAERESRRLAAVQLVASPRVLVIAHRGNSSCAPENTLSAFQSAVDAAADLVELDYHHSADNVPVVIHDGTLDRTTDATTLWREEKIAVVSKPLAELRLLDAGKWYQDRFAGERLPTLLESLQTIQTGSMTLIERKSGDAATCVRLLADRNLLDQVVVQSFDWKYVEECHKLAPSLVLAPLGTGDITEDRLDVIAKTGARLVVWHQKSLNADAIEAIHRRGWRAWTYTVNNLDRVKELVGDSIDAIITDRPADVRRTVEEFKTEMTGVDRLPAGALDVDVPRPEFVSDVITSANLAAPATLAVPTQLP